MAAWSPRRRRLVALSGLLSVLVLAVVLLWLPAWSHQFVIAQLESVFGRKVTASAVTFRFFPAEMEIRQLRISGARETDAAWLEVPRLSVLPSFGLLWEGRIVLSRVRIEQPTVRIEAFADGGDNMPRLHMGGRGLLGVRIRRLTIEGGQLVLDHQRVPLELDLPELSGRLNARRAGILAGQITLGPGEARFGDAPAIPLETQLDLVMDGPRFTLESGRVRTAHSDLTVKGELALVRRPEGTFEIDGPLDLDELDRHVTRTGFRLAGTSRYVGRLAIDGSRLTLVGHVAGHDGSWKGTAVSPFEGDVEWSNEEGVRLRDMEMGVFGGTARLDIEVPRTGGPARLAGRLDGLDADVAVARLFDIGLVGAGSAASGTVDLQWPRGRFRDLTGRVALELEPRADGRSSLGGRFRWSADRGVQRLDDVDLRTPDTHALLGGRIARNGAAEIALSARSGDLAATDALLLRLRRALGNAAAAPFDVAGTGSFDGHWRGTIHDPVYEGRVVAGDVRYLGVDWGRVDWVGRASAQEIACHSLALHKAGAELWIDGRMEPGAHGGQDGLAIRARLDAWPVEDLARAMDWDVEWKGPLSGTAEITGRRSAPFGSLALAGTAGRYWGLRYDSLALEAELAGDRIHATAGEVKVGSGRLTFRGTRTDAGEYDGTVEAAEVEIGEMLPALREGVAWGGRVGGTATLRGTLERPTLQAHLAAQRLFLGDEGIGAVEADLNGSGDGQVRIQARCRSPRTDVELEGRVSASAPYVATLVARGRETSLDPYLRVLLRRESPSVPPVVASGELTLEGPLARPTELTAALRVPSLKILVPEYPVHSDGPLLVDLAEGRITVRDLRLSGEGTNLLANGRLALLHDGPLDLSVSGDADLRALAAITRRFRARGDAKLTMTLRGTRDDPRVDGTLRLLGAGVRIKNFPHGLEDVYGSVRFTERAAELREIVGRLGGGEMRLEGESAYGRAGLLSVDLKLSGRDLTLRYPEGLRSLSDGELRLFGDGERQWLTGTIDVRQAVWTRRYDVASELLAIEDSLKTPTAGLSDDLRFDLKVNAPGTLKVDNNLANLDARADLRLQGTAENPIVLGRADIDRGRVYFQGNTYLIRRGRIEFANPQRLDPFFDIEAETRLRSYRVNLKMNGTLERVYPTLTSDPPLSAVQILNLLAGADESQVSRLAAAQTDRALLASQGAASLAAGRIAEDLGLERNAERFFGLNHFSIDPSMLKGGGVTNPGARITIGKRLSPELNAIYSTDLRGGQERLFSLEYTLRDWLSVLLTNEAGGFGIDARVHRSK